MIIIVDYDNDQIRFGPEGRDQDDLTCCHKPKSMKDVKNLIEEIINQIYAEDAKSVILDAQIDGKFHNTDEWEL
jgi:hypothetical protein